ncbi:MAG: hypothetical protein JWO85_576 [Candidatus Eremiobacteraeota bacterium]|nr:hypothetical protein [Candidatus Eremiobacteraeota bacterium]
MRNQFPECPRCDTDINASNDYCEMPKYLKDADAHRPIGEDVRDGCEFCVRETVEGIAKKWLNEGAFEDVSRMLAEYLALDRVPA